MGRFMRLLILVISVHYTWLYCPEIKVFQILGNYNKCEDEHTTNDALFICVPIPGLAISEENKNEVACREISCATVTDLGDISCSDLPATEGYACKYAPQGDLKCKEIKIYCTQAEKDFDKCDTYPVSAENSLFYKCYFDSTKGKCAEKLKTCNEIKDVWTRSCSEFSTSNSNEKICIRDINSAGCREETKCEKAKGDSNEVCNKYPVQYGKEESHICMFNSDENKCFEQYLCEQVPNPNNGIKINCKSYPVKLERTDTHECVEDTSEEKPCKEQEKTNPITTILLSKTTEISETEKALPETEKNKINKIPISQIISSIISTVTPIPIGTTNAIPTGTLIEYSSIISNNPVIINTPTTIIKESNETLVVFLGFSLFEMQSSFFTFVIHFIPVKNIIFSKFVKFTVNIIYKTFLRRLQNYSSNCILVETSTQKIVSYKCNVEVSTKNIKQIEFETDLKFDPKNHIKLIGITPFVKNLKDNLQEVNNIFTKLFTSNTTIYVLNNCTLYKHKSNQFDIYGEIKGDKPKTFTKNKNFTLMMNIECEQENKTREEDCTVSDIKNGIYNLTCNTTEILEYNLQSAISIIDEGLLLINFETYINESSTLFEPEIRKETPNFRYYKGKSTGINAGIIVSIALSSIIALVAVIGINYYFKKMPKTDSSIESAKLKL